LNSLIVFDDKAMLTLRPLGAMQIMLLFAIVPNALRCPSIATQPDDGLSVLSAFCKSQRAILNGGRAFY
jgi:hypothetical protein